MLLTRMIYLKFRWRSSSRRNDSLEPWLEVSETALYSARALFQLLKTCGALRGKSMKISRVIRVSSASIVATLACRRKSFSLIAVYRDEWACLEANGMGRLSFFVPWDSHGRRCYFVLLETEKVLRSLLLLSTTCTIIPSSRTQRKFIFCYTRSSRLVSKIVALIYSNQNEHTATTFRDSVPDSTAKTP